MITLTAELPARFAARTARELPRGEATRHAAVAAVLRPVEDSAHVLLIRRAERPGDHWAGQMGFPGGRQAPGETTLETAVRETLEEVGLDLKKHAELWGRLDDVQAISKGVARDLIIVPYVFFAAGEVELSVDPREVAAAVWADIGPMMRRETITDVHYTRDGAPIVLPGYRLAEDIVWGLTYRMLEMLFEVIRS
jgi:8-oxo-dGTP pyrophosphatase MutT (NUDIX family)